MSTKEVKIFERAGAELAYASPEIFKRISKAAEDPFVKHVSKKVLSGEPTGHPKNTDWWAERQSHIVEKYHLLPNLADLAIVASESLAFEEYKHGQA